mgnify:FL=1
MAAVWGVLGLIEMREALVSDAAEILGVYAPYVEKTAVSFEYEAPSVAEFAGRIERTLARYPYLTLWDGGVLMGYAYAGPLKERRAYDCSAELTVYLRGDARRRGYGRMLYTEQEKRLKAMGVRRAYACIAIPNGDDPYLTMDSPRFHEKMGYRRVGFFENCAEKFGRDYSMAWYEKVL